MRTTFGASRGSTAEAQPSSSSTHVRGRLPDSLGYCDDLFAELDAATKRRPCAYKPAKTSWSLPVCAERKRLKQPWDPPVDLGNDADIHVRAPFVRFNKNHGELFDPGLELVKPKVLTTWVMDRKVQPTRNYERPDRRLHPKMKTGTMPCGHQHPEEFGDPPDSLLTYMHQKWMEDHEVRRAKEIYPVHHALNKVRRLEVELEKHSEKRQYTKTLIRRFAGEDAALAEAGLAKPRQQTVRAATLLKKAMAANRSQMAFASFAKTMQPTEILKRKIANAKSCPALLLTEPPPDRRARHLWRWKGPEHLSDEFQLSTAWEIAAENDALPDRFGKKAVARTKSTIR